jgi:hypothetical protein
MIISTRKHLVACFLISIASFLSGKEYHVTTSGSPSGNGTIESPWDLNTALWHKTTVILPGDTLTIHEGTYVGNFQTGLRGTADNYIVVRGQPGKKVILDGNTGVSIDGHGALYVKGAYTIYRDLILTNSDTNRWSNIAGSFPTDIVQNAGLYVDTSEGLKFINLIIHDNVGNGVGLWKGAVDTELYGCIIFNNGWRGPDRGHGHGVYSQNENGTKVIRDNIIFNGFIFGIKVFSTSASVPLKNYIIDGNTSFNNGILYENSEIAENLFVGAVKSQADNITITNNYTYYNPDLLSKYHNITLGYLNENGKLVCKNNYVVGGRTGMYVRNWNDLELTNNVVIGNHINTIGLEESTLAPTTGYHWNNNQYHFFSSTNSLLPFYDINWNRRYSFEDWKSNFNLDKNSEFNSTAPARNAVFVRPNQFEEGRGHVTIYNWEKQATVNLDLSQVLREGSRYRIYDVQNIFGEPVVQGIYSQGETVPVPMQLIAIQPPNGTVPVIPTHTSEEFGIFLVLSNDSNHSNTAPVLTTIGNQSVSSGQSLTIILDASDEDDDFLDYSAVGALPQ